MTRLQELLDQSGRIEEGERQWQNDVMLQETESQASNTTEQVKEESEEEINESNRDHKRLRGRPKSNGTINANKEWSDEEIFLLIDARKEILSSVF